MENHCQTIAGLIEDDYQFIAAVSTGALIGLVVWMMLHVSTLFGNCWKCYYRGFNLPDNCFRVILENRH
jgi:hypothetical protein